jgi:hypothetical protein
MTLYRARGDQHRSATAASRFWKRGFGLKPSDGISKHVIGVEAVLAQESVATIIVGNAGGARRRRTRLECGQCRVWQRGDGTRERTDIGADRPIPRLSSVAAGGFQVDRIMRSAMKDLAATCSRGHAKEEVPTVVTGQRGRKPRQKRGTLGVPIPVDVQTQQPVGCDSRARSAENGEHHAGLTEPLRPAREFNVIRTEAVRCGFLRAGKDGQQSKALLSQRTRVAHHLDLRVAVACVMLLI